MLHKSLLSHAGDLAWSLWTELGVSGVLRNHSQVAIDLEPLLVVTPTLGADDPRFLEQVLCWCAAHSDRVNVSRLTMLLRALPASAQQRFEQYASTVNQVAQTSWPAAGSPWEALPRLREVPLPLQRKSLFRLRARALCGVGTRADVLCELLARGWTSAADLVASGHSKRNIARILADFESAQIVISQSRGNAFLFRASNPAAIAATLGGVPAVHPDWTTIFRLVLVILELSAFEQSSDSVRRVEAATRREVLVSLSEKLCLESPPLTRGVSNAWDLMLEWGNTQMDELASGKSVVFGGTRESKPEQETLWKKFTQELEEHPISEWEFYGHLSGFWPAHRNQLYKLMLRRRDARRQWWWFEDEISLVPHDYEKNYGDAPSWMRLTGSALLLEALDAQTGTPLKDDKPAIERAIAEVRRRIEGLSRKAS